MPDFYKMDPSAWDMGTTSLTLEQEAAYLRIVNCIHKHKAPVPDNDRVLAGLFRTSTRKARSLVNALIGAGKIQSDGHSIVNERAISDLVHRGFVSSSRAESGAKGGRTTSKRRRKPLEENNSPTANAYARGVEKSREEYSEANASDGQAVDHDDFAKQLWDRGVAFLSRHSVPERQARALIGKWRKAHDDTDIFDAFAACSKAGAVDPVPWITARLTGGEKGAKDGKPSRGASKLSAFVGGAATAQGVDWGQDRDPSRPLLARG